MFKKIFGNRNLRADIILIASALAVALSVFLIVTLTRDAGAVARVSVRGVTVAEYSLSLDGEYSINGGTNILVIEDGVAYMRYADCPDKLCVRHRAISYSGERILCLPNRVMIEVVGADDEMIGG